ncbi:MAG TPA: type II toxin-antitoxin system HicB family antitoxin [Longimicrobium sp.]|nr:type II toxin-antitoxin system HicB family antitoxin [Longimicrobium sp.]
MSPKDRAIDVIAALPDDVSWDRILDEIREAAGPIWPMLIRETGPAWGVERPAPDHQGGIVSRTYDVVVERDEEGYFVASVPGLRGCHTQARSLEQVLERIREAIVLCVEMAHGGGPQFIGIRKVTVPA